MINARLLHRLRLPLLSFMAATFALLMTQYGWMSRLETALSDHYAFSEPVAPSGRTVLVVIDKAVLEATGRYPADRSMLASALDKLREGGASRVYVDIQLGTIEAPEHDRLLEDSLKAFGPQRVSLPISLVPLPDGSNIHIRPHERFARHARLSPSEPLFDPDRRARRMAGALAGVGPAASDWLVLGDRATRKEPVAIDFSIDLGAIKRFNLMDVANGKTPPGVFKDRQVVIGVTTSNPMSVINVPVFQRLSRVETITLAAETLLVGSMPRALSNLERWGVVFAVAMLLCLVLRVTGTLTSFLLIAGGCVAWFWWAGQLQELLRVSLPLTTVPVAAIIVWQVMKLRDSRLAHMLQRLYVRLFGVGQNALVMAVEVIGDPAFVVDAQGDVVGANEPFVALVQAAMPDRKSPLQMPVNVMFPGQFSVPQERTAGGPISHTDLSLMMPDGSMRYFDSSLRSIRTVAGQVTIASLKDVTKVRNREAELTNLAFRDALTGLSNRVAFHARLHTLGADPSRRFAIHLIDLDGFKKVNDTLGHHAGDVLLAGVGSRLQKLVRPDDMVARLGGDEFAILQMDAASDGAATLASRIISSLSQPFDIEGAPARVGASIGIALWPDHHVDAAEALKLADAAMYVAKRNKPAYAIHTPEGARLVA